MFYLFKFFQAQRIGFLVIVYFILKSFFLTEPLCIYEIRSKPKGQFKNN